MNIDRRKFLRNSSAAVAASTFCGVIERPASAALSPAELERDPLRPQFHLLPAANWMNDPDGPIYWKNNYHMFYQYNPNGAYWGDMHWAHAISTDMVHWKHMPVAFSPTPGGPDGDGCFTGTSVVQNGEVVVLYTGVRVVPPDQATSKGGAQNFLESQCLATSTDPELKIWTKLPAPVIASPPPGMQVNGFRDPSPWRQGDWWYMVLGSGAANQGGSVLLYKSKDLRHWEYVHVLALRNKSREHQFDPYNPWEVWECPELFALGGKHVLIVSTLGKAYWQSGILDADTMQFHPEQAGMLDYGSFYAPKTQLDKSGNRILWGWIQEARPLQEYKAAGWAGMMSLPRMLTLGSDGKLKSSVAVEVNSLRGREQTLNVTGDEDQTERQIEAMRIEKCCGEILCKVERGAEPFTLMLNGSAASSPPWLVVEYDPHHAKQVWIDARPLPITGGEREHLELHLYIDRSVVEVFVNNEVACTKRFYYASSNPQDLCIKWIGKTTSIASFSVWQLSSISTDRPPT
ncbi:MAG TPA: glycoside hydrolase family 32 protein [Acidobacteriaceae bacterium]|nr:glycoside hydrolase family 32 protein [Acidobacteriaceae bacterium]